MLFDECSICLQLDDFQQQVSELESRLSQKTHEVEVMQSELKLVKEFRRKRAQMQKDLDEVCRVVFFWKQIILRTTKLMNCNAGNLF